MMDRQRDRLPHAWPIVLAGLIATLVVWRWVSFGAPNGGDGLQYLSHALALVQGRPYGDIGYLYSPYAWTVGPPSYPPGLPATLAPVLALFGRGMTAPRVLMHLFLLAFVLLAGRYFAREDRPTVAWTAATLVFASFVLWDRPNVVGSDLGFCAFVWGALVLADGSDSWSPRRTGAILLLGCVAISYRIAGAALVPAALALAVLRRRKVGVQAGLCAVLWLVVLAVVVTRFGLGESISAADSGAGTAGAGSRIVAELEWLLRRLDSKILRYRMAVSEAFLYPSPIDLGNHLYHVCALLLSLVGLARWLRKRAVSLGALFAGMTILMLAAVRVWSGRYIWVLTPFLCYGLFAGVDTVLSVLRRPTSNGPSRGRRPLRYATPVLAFALVSMAALTLVLQPRKALPSDEDDWARVSSELAALGPDSVRVASNRPRKVTWFTGVPAMPIARMDLDIFRQEAERHRLTHAVMTSAVNDRSSLDAWDAWAQEAPGLIRSLSEIGPIRIYELDLEAARTRQTTDTRR